MIRDITVLSRENMIETYPNIHNPAIVISISESGVAVPSFADNPNVLRTLFLHFDDVEEGSFAMSEDDAEKIIDFLSEFSGNEDQDVLLYVHCKAGVSRSAGVAAAISLLTFGDDSEFFHGEFAPNMHCYRRVLDASNLTYDDLMALREKLVSGAAQKP